MVREGGGAAWPHLGYYGVTLKRLTALTASLPISKEAARRQSPRPPPTLPFTACFTSIAFQAQAIIAGLTALGDFGAGQVENLNILV